MCVPRRSIEQFPATTVGIRPKSAFHDLFLDLIEIGTRAGNCVSLSLQDNPNNPLIFPWEPTRAVYWLAAGATCLALVPCPLFLPRGLMILQFAVRFFTQEFFNFSTHRASISPFPLLWESRKGPEYRGRCYRQGCGIKYAWPSSCILHRVVVVCRVELQPTPVCFLLLLQKEADLHLSRDSPSPEPGIFHICRR